MNPSAAKESSVADKTFAVAELFEQIMLHVVDSGAGANVACGHMLPVSVIADISGDVAQFVQYTQVNSTWHRNILMSPRLLEAIYLKANFLDHRRKWDLPGPLPRCLRDLRYSLTHHDRAPLVNPIIMHLSWLASFRVNFVNELESSATRHALNLTVVRKYRDRGRHRSGKRLVLGQRIRDMLLTQPPSTVMNINLLDSHGGTWALKHPTVECKSGVTLAMLLERADSILDQESNKHILHVKFSAV